MKWTQERYLKSTVWEWNEAVRGYWRNYERNTMWGIRELIWSDIMGNPYIEKKDKPKKKTDLFKLSIDQEEKKEVIKKPTAKEIKNYEAIQFGLTH